MKAKVSKSLPEQQPQAQAAFCVVDRVSARLQWPLLQLPPVQVKEGNNLALLQFSEQLKAGPSCGFRHEH